MKYKDRRESMDRDSLWEELKFEAGASGAHVEILGSGNRNGKILFIGDDVSLYENEDLKVSIGSAGEFLIKLCDITEISPEDYYITTLSKSDMKFRDLSPKTQELLKECLDMQIALIAPKVIVLLGQEVAETILEREVKMGEERGKIFSWKGNIKVLISYDAGFAMRSRADGGKKSKAALEFWNDLKLLVNC
jgi:DNA polymerase